MANSINISIPAALRAQAGGNESVDVAATSVREALNALSASYPELGKKLFKTETELNRFVNVYLNDEDIRFLENLDTELSAGDELAIIPAIAGG